MTRPGPYILRAGEAAAIRIRGGMLLTGDPRCLRLFRGSFIIACQVLLARTLATL